jgi:hypothetical protein
MCKDPQHTCSICSDELANLRAEGRENEDVNRRFKERPLGFHHSAVRFGDRGMASHHLIYLNGELCTEGVFEFQAGAEGWIARYVVHGDPPRREVHRHADNDRGMAACHEVLYGHVQLILKPHHVRWLALIERHQYDMDALQRQTVDGDMDGLILTTEPLAVYE